MTYLIATTILWAFSFSLIGVYLAGYVDIWFSVLMRVALATLVFLPFLKLSNVSKPFIFKLIGIGAIQLGVMYIFYYHSFLLLSVPEVLLFTVLTPIYVTLFNDSFERKFNINFMISAIIATIGAITIRYNNINAEFILGFLTVQGANICFAFGQVSYRRLLKDNEVAQESVFGWFFIGALLVASICYILFGDSSKLPTTSVQWGVLVYLGLIASGVGYFLWNKGATLVDVGTLAVMNNVLIPLGIIVNLVIWNKSGDLPSLFIGSILIFGALVVNNILTKSKINIVLE